jgi:hypothetical protein
LTPPSSALYQGRTLDDLLRAKSPGVEVIGAGSLRFFWNLLEALQEKGRPGILAKQALRESR